jgi:hypothetical protein
MKFLSRIGPTLSWLLMTSLVYAEQSIVPSTDVGPKLQWQYSPYTQHFWPSPEHKKVFVLGLEREHLGDKIDGITFFQNSFGQPSIYLYPWGRIYKNIYGIDRLSFKWTAGLLYGYVEPYEYKVPLNYNGFSPGAIVALAYEFRPGWSFQVDLLGNAGLTFQLNGPIK